MNARLLFVALTVLTVLQPAPAAVTRYHGYTFQAHLTAAGNRRHPLQETPAPSGPTVAVHEGDEYAIVVRNPLPVRVGVAVSVDGLNTIDGKRSRPADGRKWIIEPHGTITIRGWQTGMNSLRSFVFTKPNASYADWKEQRDGRHYTHNLGVVGVAWFWSAEELAEALRPTPRHFADADEEGIDYNERPSMPGAASAARKAPSRAQKSRAGTGMGRSQTNRVTKVSFDFDTGMYTNADVLAIYYEFARPQPLPKPFADEPLGFAPEM